LAYSNYFRLVLLCRLLPWDVQYPVVLDVFTSQPFVFVLTSASSFFPPSLFSPGDVVKGMVLARVFSSSLLPLHATLRPHLFPAALFWQLASILDFTPPLPPFFHSTCLCTLWPESRMGPLKILSCFLCPFPLFFAVFVFLHVLNRGDSEIAVPFYCLASSFSPIVPNRYKDIFEYYAIRPFFDVLLFVRLNVIYPNLLFHYEHTGDAFTLSPSVNGSSSFIGFRPSRSFFLLSLPPLVILPA